MSTPQFWQTVRPEQNTIYPVLRAMESPIVPIYSVSRSFHWPQSISRVIVGRTTSTSVPVMTGGADDPVVGGDTPDPASGHQGKQMSTGPLYLSPQIADWNRLCGGPKYFVTCLREVSVFW